MASARSIKRSDQPPNHWPPDVKYLPNACQASPALSAAHKESYCERLPWGSSLNPRRLELEGWCKVKPIKDEAHPAHGQFGLFAAKDIPPRTAIIQYIGIVHTETESDESSDYDLKVCAVGVNGEEALGIDSSKAGNEARFVNDYRGIAQRQNVFFEDFAEGSYRGLIFRSGAKPIKAGQELLTSYGKGYWAARRRAESPSEDAEEEVDDAQPQPPRANQAGLGALEAMLERQRQRLQQTKLATKTPSPPAPPPPKKDFKLDTLRIALQQRLRECRVKLPMAKAEQLAFDLAMTAAGVKPACLIDAFSPTPSTITVLRNILIEANGFDDPPSPPLLPPTPPPSSEEITRSTHDIISLGGPLALLHLPKQEQLFVINVERTLVNCSRMTGPRAYPVWCNVHPDVRLEESRLSGPPEALREVVRQRLLPMLEEPLKEPHVHRPRELELGVEEEGIAIALAGVLLGYPAVYTRLPPPPSTAAAAAARGDGNNLSNAPLCLLNVELTDGPVTDRGRPAAAADSNEASHAHTQQLMSFTVPWAITTDDELHDVRDKLFWDVKARFGDYKKRLEGSEVKEEEFEGWKEWLGVRNVIVSVPLGEVRLDRVAL